MNKFIGIAAVGAIAFGAGWLTPSPLSTAADNPDKASLKGASKASGPEPVPKSDDGALLAFATSAEVLDLNPEYLTSRFGVPRRKDNGFAEYSIGGCTVSYAFKNDAVTGFDVSITEVAP